MCTDFMVENSLNAQLSIEDRQSHNNFACAILHIQSLINSRRYEENNVLCYANSRLGILYYTRSQMSRVLHIQDLYNTLLSLVFSFNLENDLIFNTFNIFLDWSRSLNLIYDRSSFLFVVSIFWSINLNHLFEDFEG